MEFDFSASIFVEEQDLEEMCRLCKEENYTPSEAFSEVSPGWDDFEYYASGYIRDAVIKEIEKRLAGE